ncbi:non-hydrolyzing UDP-N-acetylglucosamine 2-epimerase [Metabacillus sp. Hm71]|uniref:non-hydrolyzing UDP-N-acetylglucosamine 2-epimerase n=1 Tax=Metabacillus sp. Hm71 TaxID=3450743 RepID=UPI003F434EA1
MKILTVIGARPQFIKACMLSKAFKSKPNIKEIIVHTGQHYDDNMSTVFFEQLKLPKPNYYLGVGSDTHGKQTAKMLTELERVMITEKPDIVLVYGDTNSTLAGSLAAAKLHIPVAHVEAGLRSFNKKMPEEINRILTDHLSTWLFCPSQTAVENLKREGIQSGVYQTGDIMYDSVLYYKPFALQHSNILSRLNLSAKTYYLATIHRAENTDDPQKLKALLETLQKMNEVLVFPMHPRTKHKIQQWGLTNLTLSPNIKIVEPLNYFDMLTVESQAKAILTDSGGVQKEAYMLGVPCITLREETEWVETVSAGWNQVTGANTQCILEAVATINVPKNYPALFGDGQSSKQICEILAGLRK